MLLVFMFTDFSRKKGGMKMALYNTQEIAKVHKDQLYILKEFASFCDNHDIHYTLDFGTMLGSVRHEGFIPWDDDIDIAMLRPDYELFLDLTQGILNKHLFVQNFKTDPGFIHSFTRIRLNDSLALQEDWKHLKCHHGIFIDVFPYDTLPNNHDDLIRHQYLLYVIQEAKLYRVKMKAEKKFDKDKVLAESPLSLLSLSVLNTYQTEVMTKYNKHFDADDFVTHMSQGFKNYTEYQRSVGEHLDTIDVIFEKNMYPIPRAYDRILRSVYGNYLEYPPVKERAPHHGVIKYITRF